MPDPDAQGASLLARAIDLYDAGELQRCALAVQEALACAVSQGQRETEVRIHLVGARQAMDAQDCEAAARHIGAAQTLARQLDSSELIARSLIAASRLGITLGDFDQSAQELDRARALVDDDGLVAFEFLEGVVNTQASLGQIDDALVTLERLLAVADRLGLPRYRSLALGSKAGRLFSKGYMQLEAGQSDAGRQTLELSVALGREALQAATLAGARRQTLSVLNNLAGALSWLGLLDEALATFEEHRQLAQALGQETTLVNAMLGEARVLMRLGQPAAARALALRAIPLGERLNAGRITAWLHRLLSDLDEAEGDLVSALARFKRHHGLLEQVNTDAALLHSRILAVRLETERVQREAASERQQADLLRRANQALQLRAEILSREAMQDALTGLANRRRIDLQLAAGKQRPGPGEHPCCVALLDVDHFKRINDHHSHAVGDLVLVQLAALIARQCREGDLPARYGGEEFLVSFQQVGLERAAAACERLRAAIAGHDWSSIAPGLAVTVSIGVVDLRQHASVADGLAAADRLMYAAKHAGRNRVCAVQPAT